MRWAAAIVVLGGVIAFPIVIKAVANEVVPVAHASEVGDMLLAEDVAISEIAIKVNPCWTGFARDWFGCQHCDFLVGDFFLWKYRGGGEYLRLMERGSRTERCFRDWRKIDFERIGTDSQICLENDIVGRGLAEVTKSNFRLNRGWRVQGNPRFRCNLETQIRAQLLLGGSFCDGESVFRSLSGTVAAPTAATPSATDRLVSRHIAPVNIQRPKVATKRPPVNITVHQSGEEYQPPCSSVLAPLRPGSWAVTLPIEDGTWEMRSVPGRP